MAPPPARPFITTVVQREGGRDGGREGRKGRKRGMEGARDGLSAGERDGGSE